MANNNPPNSLKFNKSLLPFSYFYRWGVSFRNNLFKMGIFKRKEYDIPVICVGNITVGGTGKTPHTEYLVRLLKDKYRVAVLSRGYKRKSRGFVLSDEKSTSKTIGDEPFQVKSKFPDIIVAVDKSRRRGIKKLLALKNPPQVIILDDGFQHRYVKSSYTIVLSDYNRPVYEDKLLPVGRLREPLEYLQYANDVIVTKCPADMQPLDFRLISRNMNLFPYQNLFFTKFVYQKLEPVFNSGRVENLEIGALRSKHALLVTGIANPKALVDQLSQYCNYVDTMEYPDHHKFTNGDMKHILSRFNKIDVDDKIIIVTEKDAVKLQALNLKDLYKYYFYFYYIPIEVAFVDSDNQEKFNKGIINHVEKYRSNNKLY